MDELVYWIWLSLACSPGGATFSKLKEKFSSAKEIYEAEEYELSKIIGYRSSDRKGLFNKSLDKAAQIYEFCTKHKVGLLPYCHDSYPKSLRSIASPPVLLYYRGSLPDFNRKFFVSVVGTRALSDYGRRAAFRISHDLAMAGSVVVSGMACGIDSVALAGAISAGGTTVAVIGSGIDVCYPKQHQKLAREIVKNGCVMTEYAPGTPPAKHNFPKRNRIISGLSAATLVIEGREKSGAYITANYAKEQDRALYALPGNIGSSTSELSNLLIKNGARLCSAADDIVRDFQDKYPGVINPFNLPDKLRVDMMSVLRELSVVAVCQGDNIFTHTFNRPIKAAASPPPLRRSEPEIAPIAVDLPNDFDKTAMRIYKKIPIGDDISLEELVDDEIDMRTLMKTLLKLEMGGFVKMLPSERVTRKTY